MNYLPRPCLAGRQASGRGKAEEAPAATTGNYSAPAFDAAEGLGLHYKTPFKISNFYLLLLNKLNGFATYQGGAEMEAFRVKDLWLIAAAFRS